MIAKGQSADARAKRLALGRCPVHGVFMCPETMLLDAAEAWFFGYYEPETVFLVRCPRGDCDIWALARDTDEIVRVLTKSEVSAAQAFDLGDSSQFQTFIALVEDEERAGGTLIEETIERLRALSLRSPS